ncbi:MAG: tRNA (guanosine(46)-N7)-methyltransferase TrmB [Polyangiales bacterium]
MAPRAPEAGIDLVDVFSLTHDIEMEIGFGRGMFLMQRAQAVPGLQLLGLEIKTKLAYQVAQRCERLGLAGVKVLAGDVRALLPAIRPDRSLARVFLHFPDPWWKKRHAKRRLAGEDLLAELARLLRPGGEIFVQTDVEERATDWLQKLTAHPAFELADGGLVGGNPYAAVSNRERRAIEDGLPVFRVLAHRRSS